MNAPTACLLRGLNSTSRMGSLITLIFKLNKEWNAAAVEKRVVIVQNSSPLSSSIEKIF